MFRVYFKHQYYKGFKNVFIYYRKQKKGDFLVTGTKFKDYSFSTFIESYILMAILNR